MAELHEVKDTCLSIKYLVKGPLENNVYLIEDELGAIVVDPTCDADDIIAALGDRTLDAIVLTHFHYDHVGAARDLREKTGATVFASLADSLRISGEQPVPESHTPFEPCPVDYVMNQGDVVKIGYMAWRVILTPGHSKGSMCLYIDPRFGVDKQAAPVLIAGDTLFAGAIGRTDFEGGSMDDMRRSLRRLAVLPDQTVVLPGHGPTTTIGDERQRVFARYAQ